jgi:hypothetical protein
MRTNTALLWATLVLAACGDDVGTSAPGTTGTTDTTGTPPPPTSTEPTTTSGDSTTTPDTSTSGTTGTTQGESTVGETSTTTQPPDTGETGDPPACLGEAQTLMPERSKVVLVIDRSVRMRSDMWDHDVDAETPEVIKWNSVRAALDAALTAHEAKYAIAAAPFPGLMATNEYDISSCPVDPEVAVPAAGNNREEILAAVPLPDPRDDMLIGAWPIADVLPVAYDHLRTFPSTDTRIAIMIGLHMPTCDVDAQSDQERFEVFDEHAPLVAAETFAQDGIPTHVIIVEATDAVTPVKLDNEPDGQNPVVRFAEFAAGAGGEFTNVADEAELTATLSALLSSLPELDCTVDLTAPLTFPDQAELRLDGALLPRVSDCATEDGWKFVEPEPPFTEIELCGTGCLAVFAADVPDLIDCSDDPG